jgi:lipocalin
VIDGYAYQTKPDTEPRQLKVVFNSDDAAPFPAPYWILELGPINKDGLYDYAIVSDSFSAFLFVLARDVETYNTLYKESVSATLVKLGFTGYTAPIETYQSADCVYESTARKQQIKALPVDKEVVRDAPTTVSTLDVPSYMGYWYNVYGDKFTVSTTLRNSLCNTANYVLQEDGTFSVHNSGNKNAVDGVVSSIDGYAYIQDASEPGQLKLHLDGVPTLGDYWVLATGPVVEGKYEYSIVSDPKGLSLYVLARDYETFAKKYEAEVLAMLEDMGFNGRFTTPIAMYQGTDCAYEALKK